MLYVDKEKHQLYIFVRLSNDASNTYLVADVSPIEVESYMNDETGLLNILSQKIYRRASITDGKISFESGSFNNFDPTERMKQMNKFDPELCDDDVWLEIFLNRINNNQPIEIA